MRFNPPHYKGSSAPEDAEFWVQEVEQLFSLLECPDRERVMLATHVLQGAAGDWWRLVRRTTLQGQDIREITWDEFRTLFLKKFFPRYSRDRCYQEFLALTQGDSTVEEYTRRFAELRRFSPHQDERDMT